MSVDEKPSSDPFKKRLTVTLRRMVNVDGNTSAEDQGIHTDQAESSRQTVPTQPPKDTMTREEAMERARIMMEDAKKYPRFSF